MYWDATVGSCPVAIKLGWLDILIHINQTRLLHNRQCADFISGTDSLLSRTVRNKDGITKTMSTKQCTLKKRTFTWNQQTRVKCVLSIVFVIILRMNFSILWTQFSVAYSITDNFTKMRTTMTLHKMLVSDWKIYF